jgi:apolipoprotein N-acyltransferase
MNRAFVTSLLLAVTGGWMMSLSFPPYDLPVLQFPAWILLLKLGESETNGRRQFGIGYLYLLVWNIVTTYWLMMATFVGGVAAILANSLVMSAPLWLIWRLQRQEPQSVWLNSLLIAGIWTAFEFFHHHWQLSWPWLTLANAWSVWPQSIQWISVTGHLGITFWVVFVSSLFFLGIRNLQFRSDFYSIGYTLRKKGKPVLFGGFLVVVFPLYSWFSGGEVTYPISGGDESTHQSNFPSSESSDHDPIEIEAVIVQPDQNSNLPYGGHASLDRLIDHLAELTESVITPDTDVILWPENAVDGAVQVQSAVSSRLHELSLKWDAELITGAMLVETYSNELDSDNPSTIPNLFRTSPDGVTYNIYNAALHYRAGTSDALLDGPAIYKKANLVPIVERVPYVETLDKIPVISRIDWASLQGYGKGSVANNFPVNGTVQAAPLICYDSVYPDWIRKFVLDGASVLAIVTNDGWWGNTSGHIQHFEYARLRAIEFRRPVLRSANNGISGVILPTGDVLKETSYATQDAFRIRIPVESSFTFYARFGNIVGWVSVVLTIIALVIFLRKRL